MRFLTVRKLQQVGLPVSPSLVSVALKSCQSKICSKSHMREKLLDTSCYQSELTFRPLHCCCLDFPRPICWTVIALLPRVSYIISCLEKILYCSHDSSLKIRAFAVKPLYIFLLPKPGHLLFCILMFCYFPILNCFLQSAFSL